MKQFQIVFSEDTSTDRFPSTRIDTVLLYAESREEAENRFRLHIMTMRRFNFMSIREVEREQPQEEGEK